MFVVIEGIRKDFLEVVTLELDLQGGREGLKVLECVRKWYLWGSANSCVTRELGHLRAGKSQVKRLEGELEVSSYKPDILPLTAPA